MLERRQDDLLLDERHLLRPDLDPEVAARNHDAVRGLDDRRQIAERLRFLDLGDHLRLGAGVEDQLAQRADVVDRADEREGDVVDTEAQCELEVPPVLVGERGNGKRNTR